MRAWALALALCSLARRAGGLPAPRGSRADFFGFVGGGLGRLEPVQAPRPRVDESFAVQLMRTSYQVCEELKFVAMDQFQKEFYLYRADEWLPYRDRCARFVLQGSLSQPEYLDFISFCQYHSIEDCMRRGQMEFTERVGAEGETRHVRRPDALRDNKLLPREHTRRVGNQLLDHLRERFEGNVAILDRTDCRSPEELVKGTEQAVKCMGICGYGTQWTVLPEAILPDTPASGASGALQGPKLRLVLSGSALPTAWGQRRLAKEGNVLRNDFEVKVAQAWLQRQGIASRLLKTTYAGEADVVHSIELLNA